MYVGGNRYKNFIISHDIENHIMHFQGKIYSSSLFLFILYLSLFTTLTLLKNSNGHSNSCINLIMRNCFVSNISRYYFTLILYIFLTEISSVHSNINDEER